MKYKNESGESSWEEGVVLCVYYSRYTQWKETPTVHVAKYDITVHPSHEAKEQTPSLRQTSVEHISIPNYFIDE